MVLETDFGTVNPISFFIYSNMQDMNCDIFTDIDQIGPQYSNGMIYLWFLNSNSEMINVLEFDVYSGNASNLDENYVKEIRFFKVL